MRCRSFLDQALICSLCLAWAFAADSSAKTPLFDVSSVIIGKSIGRDYAPQRGDVLWETSSASGEELPSLKIDRDALPLTMSVSSEGKVKWYPTLYVSVAYVNAEETNAHFAFVYRGKGGSGPDPRHPSSMRRITSDNSGDGCAGESQDIEVTPSNTWSTGMLEQLRAILFGFPADCSKQYGFVEPVHASAKEGPIVSRLVFCLPRANFNSATGFRVPYSRMIIKPGLWAIVIFDDNGTTVMAIDFEAVN